MKDYRARAESAVYRLFNALKDQVDPAVRYQTTKDYFAKEMQEAAQDVVLPVQEELDAVRKQLKGALTLSERLDKLLSAERGWADGAPSLGWESVIGTVITWEKRYANAFAQGHVKDGRWECRVRYADKRTDYYIMRDFALDMMEDVDRLMAEVTS